MDLIIARDGSVRCIYGEAIDLPAIGTLNIQRASHVEPNVHGQWFADLRPSNGPVIGPFRNRSEALDAEFVWLADNWLSQTA